MRFCIILIMTLLFSTAQFSAFVPAHADEEIQNIDETEWFQFLDTDVATISAPALDNMTHLIYNTYYSTNGIYSRYAQRLKKAVGDELIGMDIDDSSGPFNDDSVAFFYNIPREKRAAGSIIYSDSLLEFWKFDSLTEDQRKNTLLKLFLATYDDAVGPVKIYSEMIGEALYTVIESISKGEGRTKGKRFKTLFCYRTVDNFSTVYWFNIHAEIDNKFAEEAIKVFNDIRRAVIYKGKTTNMTARHILYSASELQRAIGLKKVDTATVLVERGESGEQELIDAGEELIDDKEHVLQEVLNVIDANAKNSSKSHEFYFASGVLSEYNKFGDRYGAGFNKDRAINYYKRSIESSDNYIYPHFNLAILYARDKEYDKAIKHLKKCVEIEPINLSALFMLGKFYEESNDYENAYASYKKAKDIISRQEQLWCPDFTKAVKKKELALKKKADHKKYKKPKNEFIRYSSIADLELMNSMLENSSFLPSGFNVLSHEVDGAFWYAKFKKKFHNDRLCAKWYSPNGQVFREDREFKKALYHQTFYCSLPINEMKSSRMPGLWRIEVYYKDELLDTKYFYILDR